jgi:Zn-dependent membrane protease YugP
MFFFDPMYIVFAAPALLLMLYAQWKVQSTYSKYAQVQNMQRMTGASAARRLLDAAGLSDVPIEEIQGKLTDNYDPTRRVLRLSSAVYRTPSVAAMGIAAHEVGHAIQHKEHYGPMSARSALVPAANLGSTLGYVFFVLGVVINLTGLVWVGVALFSAGVLFALVTLPVELNASSRAKQMLRTLGLTAAGEDQGVEAVLSAAALTYVAALLQAVGTLLYYLWIASGMRRSND